LCSQLQPYSANIFKVKILFASCEQGTPLGCFDSLDVLGAILDLIRASLVWNLESPAYLGLSRTSLQEVHGKRILAFFKTLPECPFEREQSGVLIEMYEVQTLHLSACHVHPMKAG
jgi:hypothetical protein